MNMQLTSRPFQLLVSIGGIMGCFLVYGLLQEKLMTTNYAPGQRFSNSAFLVLCNRIVAITIAVVMISWRGESMRAAAPIANYATVSTSNFVATFCQYDALKYVSFPTQTLGKCGKMIPVLIIGSLIYRKTYSWKDYMVALVIMGGSALFLMSGEISSKAAGKHDSIYGLMLMLVYLSADGFTSTLQERLFEKHSSSYNQMLYVNSVSMLFSFAALLPDGSLFTALSFCYEHPLMLVDALTLSVAAALGQIVILFTIRTFGALMFSTIMTIRQFLSLLLSSVFFLHPLSIGQWVGATVVFGILYYKEAFMKSHKHQGSNDGDHASTPGSSHALNTVPILPLTNDSTNTIISTSEKISAPISIKVAD